MKIREHIDDGYTGTNFNRPAFQKMIGLVKKNEIRTILVKDLSRFARDYIEAGAYIEQIFPFMRFALFQSMIIMIVIIMRMESVVWKFHSKTLSMITTQKIFRKKCVHQ